MQEEELSSTTEEIEAVADIPEEVKGFASKPIEEAEPSEGSDIWWVPKTRGLIIEKDDDIAVWWDTKEAIGVYGTRLTNSKFTGTNKYKSASTTSFSGGSLFSSPKYAYYPYNASNDSNSQTAVEGNIPQTQSFSTSIKRVNYDYKIGTYKSRSLTGYNFTFSHIVTFVKFAVNTTGTKLEGEKLQSIKLTATGADGQKRQLWGDFTMNLTKAAASSLTCGTADAECNTMTLKWSNTPTIYTNGTITGYMTTIPAVQKGDKLEFEVLTENYKATFTRTSEVDFAPNLLVTYPISLINMDDVVIENLNGEEEDDEDPVTPEEIEVKINSFKFTVAQNPGKILGRELYWDSSSKETKSRTVTEVVCEVDNENRKIKAFIPYLNDRKLVPTFEHPDGLVMCTTSEIVTSGETEVDFSTELEIAIGDPNSTTNFAVYSIELTNTGLPVVVINQSSGTTDTESNSEYQKASAAWYSATGAKWQPKDSDWEMDTKEVDNFMVYNPDGTSALSESTEPVLASTRVRGNVTQQMPKKAFAVKLDKKNGVLGMPKHKRWVLLANWKDRTLMRNEVAFGMAKVFSDKFSDGIAWNPSGQHVELVYNGVHVGNYYLCEQIKIDGNRLDINDPYDAKDSEVGDPASYGYLLENDDNIEDDNSSNLMSTGSGDCWFYTKCYIPFIFKDDLDNDGNSSSKIRTYVQNFVRGVEDELYAGTLDESKLDVASFVDFLLLQELMLNSEMKHPKSCYMYINNGKIYGGPIWDFDWNTLPTNSSYSEEGYSYTQSMLAKASCYHASSYPSKSYGSFLGNDKNYVWYPMLVKNATFKAKAAERWNAVKGALQAYAATIPAMAQKLAMSADVNDNMWCVDSKNNAFRGDKYGIGGWSTSAAGYCGDEAMDFEEACTNLMNMLNNRISGMSYVANQSWPSITYK